MKKENSKLIRDKRAHGDASELGLIKFCEPILSLEKAREEFPVFSADGLDCFI